MSTALDHVRHSCGIAGEEVAEQVDSLERENAALYARLEEEQAETAKLREQKDAAILQLLTTQAHAARVENALKHLWHNVQATGKRLDLGIAPEVVKAALSTSINLDALHEDRARECERLAFYVVPHGIAALIRQEAAAHRAKKGNQNDL